MTCSWQPEPQTRRIIAFQYLRRGQRHTVQPSETPPSSPSTAPHQQVVPEHAGRAGVREDVRVPLLNGVVGEAPVALAGALRQGTARCRGRVSGARMQVAWQPSLVQHPASPIPIQHMLHPLQSQQSQSRRPAHAAHPNYEQSHETGCDFSSILVINSPSQRTVSWFSRKVTEREGHQPSRPAGLPVESRSRQYSQRSNTGGQAN